MILSPLSSFAPIIFAIIMVGILVIAFVMAGKKMKKYEEERKRKEADFFAAYAAGFIAQTKEKDKVSDASEVSFKKDNRIVVLDGYVLNPGDLSWDGFGQFGEIKVYDRTSPDQIVDRIGDSNIVITNKTVITREIMSACPSVKYIGVIATGFNVVDVEAARDLGITVTNVPGYGTDAVAQFTFALLLEMCNQVGKHSDSVMKGDWCREKNFSYSLTPLSDISGKTLGIIGYGSIGSKVAEIAIAFGMKVLVNSRTKKSTNLKVKWVELDELLSESDVITLHCPLTKDNEELINEDSINKMKDGVKLINTARGGLINENALVEALNNGKISGAAVDVISSEPMKDNSILFNTKNLIITPHIAWASHEARERLMGIAVDNVRMYLINAPKNVVS